jgi:hypothetical protein
VLSKRPCIRWGGKSGLRVGHGIAQAVAGIGASARRAVGLDVDAAGPSAGPGRLLHAAMFAGQRAEQIDPARMIEEQFRFGVAYNLGHLTRELAVGEF